MSNLPKGWVEASIGELADYVSRGRSPKYVERSELPVINQRCVRWHGVDETYVKFVDPATWYQWDEDRYVRQNDILWNSTGTGTIGRAALFSRLPSFERAVVDSHVTVVRTSAAIEAAYLFGYIQSPFVQHKIEDMQSGSTNQVELNRSEILSTVVPVAPLAEQRRIVAKVDGLTARTTRAREELDRVPTLIARYKQRLLALAFSGELTAGWRQEYGGRDPVPASIEDLSESLRYGTAKKSYPEPNGVAVLRIPNVASGRISLEDLKYSDLEPKEFAKLRLNEGDILVVRSNGSVELVGRPALVTGDAVGLAYAGYLIRIRPRQDVVKPKFLTLMLEAPAIRSIIESGARSTSGVNNVNATELGALTVPLFDIEEQTEIVRRIESAFGWLDRMAAEHAAAARLLPKLDAAILAKAFRGELLPQDPKDEPAYVLLERIKAERSAAGTESKSGRGRKPKGSKSMTEKALPPRDRLLKDSEKWPVVGLPFEAIAMRNSMPHDTLRDALFELLSGPTPALQQRFDNDAEVIVIQRVPA